MARYNRLAPEAQPGTCKYCPNMKREGNLCYDCAWAVANGELPAGVVDDE